MRSLWVFQFGGFIFHQIPILWNYIFDSFFWMIFRNCSSDKHVRLVHITTLILPLKEISILNQLAKLKRDYFMIYVRNMFRKWTKQVRHIRNGMGIKHGRFLVDGETVCPFRCNWFVETLTYVSENWRVDIPKNTAKPLVRL